MRKTPVTLGVLAIVFGCLIGLGNLINIALSSVSSSLMNNLGTAAATAPRRPGEPDPALMMERSRKLMTEVAPYTLTLQTGKLLLSIALAVIGFGLYKRRRWARSGAIGWGALAMLYLAVEVAINVTILQPRANALMREMFASMPNAANGNSMMELLKPMQGVGVVFNLLIFAPFPIVLLALCGRRSAAADFVD